jgi:spoIIIJ-associated protein
MDKEESIQYARKHLEDLLSFFSANLTVSASCDEDVIELSVPSSSFNSILIGRNAETLRAFQFMISTMLRNHDAELTRVNIDIAGYKKQRADKLADQAREWIEEVRSTGNTKVLDLNAADRRVVHGVASEYSDIESHSEGEGRERKLIIAQVSS